MGDARRDEEESLSVDAGDHGRRAEEEGLHGRREGEGDSLEGESDSYDSPPPGLVEKAERIAKILTSILLVTVGTITFAGSLYLATDRMRATSATNEVVPLALYILASMVQGFIFMMATAHYIDGVKR